MAANSMDPIVFGAISAAVGMYNADQINTMLSRLANGMTYQGNKANFEAIQAIENPHPGDFYNAVDTDINYAYFEEKTLVKTEDVELDPEKTYYDSLGVAIENPAVESIADYYEYKIVGKWDKVGGVFKLPAYLENAALEAKYVKAADMATYLQSYVTQSSLTTTLADYVTSTALTTQLEGYVTTTSLSTTLGGYVTSTALTQALAGYTATSDLGTWLETAGYITGDAVDSKISTAVQGLQNASQVGQLISNALQNYKDNEALETWIQSKGFATTSQLPSEQAQNVQAIQQKLAAVAALTPPDRTDVSVYEIYDLVMELMTALGYSAA